MARTQLADKSGRKLLNPLLLLNIGRSVLFSVRTPFNLFLGLWRQIAFRPAVVRVLHRNAALRLDELGDLGTWLFMFEV